MRTNSPLCWILSFTFLFELARSICTGSQYWNPLNNACVDRTNYFTLECPWNYPNLYYADPSTKMCVTRCPTTPSLYADDFTQTCVSSKIFLIFSMPMEFKR